MAKLLFYGVEAYLGRVTDQHLVEVWLDKSQLYDTAKLFAIDLSATPSKDFASAKIDDYVLPADLSIARGGTSLGPRYPGSARGAGGGHPAEAAVYLTEDEVKRAKDEAKWPAWPQGGAQEPYRWQLRVHDDGGGKLRRYFGFHAMFTSTLNGKHRFDIFESTDHLNAKPILAVLDPQNEAQHDGIDFAVFSAPGQFGPLFLRWDYAASIGLAGAKIPIGLLGDE